MRRFHIVIFLALLACSQAACAQSPLTSDPASVPEDSAVAFVDVNVVTMQTPEVLAHRTVVVRSGRVESIQDAAVPLPSGVVAVQGNGRYLLPGLIDMHVHVRTADMPSYRAAGITTVRNMWGFDALAGIMSDVADGTIAGPRIISASPGVDGTPVSWPGTIVLEDARQARGVVNSLQTQGWSAIKVYTNLPAASYDSVLRFARATGIEVWGHVPLTISVEHAINMGQRSIEHFTGYERAFSRGARRGPSGWEDADTTRYPSLVALTVQHDVWNCPTLTIISTLARQAGVDMDKLNRNRRAFIRQLAAAGAPLLAGTDAGIDVVPAGFTLQSELEEYVAAGLSNYQALRTATVSAAQFLHLQDTGTIEQGKRADLLLVEGNPLEDVRALRHVSGVMFHGRWLSGQALH